MEEGKMTKKLMIKYKLKLIVWLKTKVSSSNKWNKTINNNKTRT